MKEKKACRLVEDDLQKFWLVDRLNRGCQSNSLVVTFFKVLHTFIANHEFFTLDRVSPLLQIL